MIRTANLTASLSRNAGGLLEGVRRLVQSLNDVGVGGRVLGLEDEFTGQDLPVWQPAEVSAFKPTWPGKFGYSPRFLEELLAFDPDLIHTHGIWVYPSVATNVYSRKRRKPYMISPHGMLDPWAVQNSRWKKAVAYFLYERVHLRESRCLRALCEPEARSMRELGLKNDIAIIPNGIDFPNGSAPTAAPWSGLIGAGKKVLLYLGRIHPKKGIPNLLRAWSTHRNNQTACLSDWALVIAGWDQDGHELELQRLATELGLVWTANHGRPAVTGESSVFFLGPQFNAAKEACYHFCDAFILPSFSEGLPMVVLEAWANGKPVIMTPQCNLLQGFSSGAALRVDSEPASIAEGLRNLGAMPECQRAEMGVRARALAVERFVWPKIAEQLKKVYEWMLGGGPKPSCIADF